MIKNKVKKLLHAISNTAIRLVRLIIMHYIKFKSNSKYYKRESKEKWINLLSNYSLEDILQSMFAINLWLPNIGAMIKCEYLYCVIECLHKSLPNENKIKSYDDFLEFWELVSKNTPDFRWLEDYLPIDDWGEIRYYFDGHFFKIFYGASLINPYDFYSAFEIIHFGIDNRYNDILGQSVKSDFWLCLNIQNEIITNLSNTNINNEDIYPGYWEAPPMAFRESCNQYIDKIKDRLSSHQAERYIFNADNQPETHWKRFKNFEGDAFNGYNCNYLFIKANKRLYPILPRKSLSVLYDIWGDMLWKNFDEIEKDNFSVDNAVENELISFILKRVYITNILKPFEVIDNNSNIKVNFAASIPYKNRIVLFHIVPIRHEFTNLNKYINMINGHIESIKASLSEGNYAIKTADAKIIINLNESNKNDSLEAEVFVITPYILTKYNMINLKKVHSAIFLTLDQIVGLIDEIDDSMELFYFLDFYNHIRNTTMVSPFNSILDMFGSFRDTQSVLIYGAKQPDAVILDSGLGTNYRYNSLKKYWSLFPETNFYGHPREWKLSNNSIKNMFVSRNRLLHFYFQSIENTTFFIYSSDDLFEKDAYKINDLVLQCIRDALDLYQNDISKCSVFGKLECINVYCMPSIIVKQSDKLNHLTYLLPLKSYWISEANRIGMYEVGIVFVYDLHKVTELLIDAKDRSTQIDILIDILNSINRLFANNNMKIITEYLKKQRIKANRYRIDMIPREVSFPDELNVIIPETKEYKKADNDIAAIAMSFNVEPGIYKGEKAKEYINLLKDKYVIHLNERILQYNYEEVIPILISNMDTLVHKNKDIKYKTQKSINQEVDYDRITLLSTEQDEFLHDHQNYRYLVEKFIQLLPRGESRITIDELKRLLGMVERLINLYSASDTIHYDLLPVKLSIDEDYIVKVLYSDEYLRMEKDYENYLAKIRLGLECDRKDFPDGTRNHLKLFKEIDIAFEKDFGFKIKDVAGIGKVLSLWAEAAGVVENKYYSATLSLIQDICTKHIRNINKETIEKVLEYLCLRSDEVLFVGDNITPESDIPVWEHYKRKTRYTLKPIIRIGDDYFWGPYSIIKSIELWSGIAVTRKLPIFHNAPNINGVLESAHLDLEKSMENLIFDIVSRYTGYCKRNIYPHDYDTSLQDIGDFDVLALSRDKSILIGIEAKIIDPAYCRKDARRIKYKIFGRNRENGEIKDGYIQKVERRHNYLKKNAKNLISSLGWDANFKKPKVISLFVTQRSFWITFYPPIKTEIIFVESAMVNSKLKEILN